METLNVGEDRVLANFQYQVANGGLCQYIGNGYANEELSELVDVLKKVGALDTITNLKEATFYIETEDCECDYCVYGCQEDCEDNDEECDCECDWQPREESKDIFEMVEDNETSYDNVSGWNDFVFYKSKDYKLIEETLEANEARISKNNSVIMDMIEAQGNGAQ